MFTLTQSLHGWLGTVVGFVIGLIPLIIAHEFGHMIMAKLMGVWAREFGIGYPPRIMKLFKWQETEFTLNWLPFGGFTRMEGEATFTPDEQKDDSPEARKERELAEEHSLYAKPAWRRILIYLGGPVMNVFTAWLIAIVIFMTGVPDTQVVIDAVAPNSPAAIAGMQQGDVIVAVNDVKVATVTEVASETEKVLDQQTKVTVQRDQTLTDLLLIPRSVPPQGEGAMGIGIITVEVPDTTQHFSIGESVKYGSLYIARVTALTVSLPFYIVRENLSFKEARPVGVIGISQITQHSVEQSIEQSAAYPFLNVLVLISISLGIFNLLPIPALDGGRILFALIEHIRRKPLPPAVEERIHGIVLMIMVVLFIVITALDIFSPIPLP
jgi:regulator of sigma E protease